MKESWGCVYKMTEKRPIQIETNILDQKVGFQAGTAIHWFWDNDLNYYFYHFYIICTSKK